LVMVPGKLGVELVLEALWGALYHYKLIKHIQSFVNQMKQLLATCFLCFFGHVESCSRWWMIQQD
jgi:hypothetical protein